MKSTEIFKSKVVVSLSLFCLLATLFVSPLVAQERFGSLTGTAKDESGAVLPGVTVTITNKATNRSVTLVTDTGGAYSARNLDPGQYSVQFDLPGFSLTEYPDVNVRVGQTFRMDTTMKVGGVETTVEVTDVVPLIDTQSTLIAHNITALEFDILPKTRTF